MSKIVLVETISTFRHVYAVRLEDNEPSEWACDDVVLSSTSDENYIEEFAQKHISENVVSYRDIDKAEYIRLFDELQGGLFTTWPEELKTRYIYDKKQEPVLP